MTDALAIQIDGPTSFGPASLDLYLKSVSSALHNRREAIASCLRWLSVLEDSLGHMPYVLRAERRGELVGMLPLALVKSWLFGRYLVSLPYVNSSGVIALDNEVAAKLVDSAVSLADEVKARYLELRSEQEILHPSLGQKYDTKFLMRRVLPKSPAELWDSFKSKLRSQIRSGQRNDFDVCFGREDQLGAFYSVFSENMRDLGTPVYSLGLFSSILHKFGENAELCILRLKGTPVATALLIHEGAKSEVPSASSLRAYNHTNANMVMYWHLLERAISRGKAVFDFGRSTLNSNTYKFKAQWGAEPHPSVWQYYVRRGTINEMRPEHSKFGLAIRAWKRLPLWMSRLIGPRIVRGIP